MCRSHPVAQTLGGLAFQRYDRLGLAGLKDETFVSVVGNFIALRPVVLQTSEKEGETCWLAGDVLTCPPGLG